MIRMRSRDKSVAHVSHEAKEINRDFYEFFVSHRVCLLYDDKLIMIIEYYCKIIFWFLPLTIKTNRRAFNGTMM